MDKRILIGGITVVILIIIIIVLLMKKEKYTSSGTASPVSNNPQNLLTVDGNGNITTTTSVDVTSANVEGGLNVGSSLSVNGYPGNPGDVLVSNGSGSPPAWIGQIGKLIAFKTYKMGTNVYNAGDTIQSFVIPFNFSPEMLVFVEFTMNANPNGDAGLFQIGVKVTLGTSTNSAGGLADSRGTATTNNFKFVFTGISGNTNTLTIASHPTSTIGFKGANGLDITDSIAVYVISPPNS